MIEREEVVTPTGVGLTQDEYDGLQADNNAVYHLSMERYSLGFNWHPNGWHAARTASHDPVDAIVSGGYLIRVFFSANDNILKTERMPSEASSDQNWSAGGDVATGVSDTVTPSLVIQGGTLYCFYYTTGNQVRFATSANHGGTWLNHTVVGTQAAVTHLAATPDTTYPRAHVAYRGGSYRTTLLYYYHSGGSWNSNTKIGGWPYPFDGFDAIQVDGHTVLLAIATDLPPVVGLKGEGSTVKRIGLRRQGIIGMMQTNSGWSDPFEIDVLDRPRTNYAYRVRPKLFRSATTDHRIFLIASGADGNRWDAVRVGMYANWNHLSFRANLLYMSSDGRRWSSPMAVMSRTVRPDDVEALPYPEPAMVVNPPYVYLLDRRFCRRAHLTRLLSESPSSAVRFDAYGNVSGLQKSLGGMHQSSFTLDDADNAIPGSFFFEPGDFLARIFLGRWVYNAGTSAYEPVYSLCSTELVDYIGRIRDENNVRNISVVSRDMLSLMADRIQSASTEEVDGQIVGLDGFDTLAHIAAYSGKWDTDGDLYKEGAATRGGAHLAWKSEVDNFDLSLSFQLGNDPKYQYAGVIFRAHNEVDGSETCYELRYAYGNEHFAVTVSGTQSLSTAMQSGELYAANGDVVPAVGDRFRVTGTNDFTCGALAAAKGNPPAANDIFIVVSNTATKEEVAYMGSSADHDGLVLYKIEAGAYTRVADIQTSVSGWDNTTVNHLYVRLVNSQLLTYYKTPATATYTAASVTAGLEGADSMLTGPEDELASTPLLSGYVGLSAYSMATIKFFGLGFVDHNTTLTVEDSIQIAAAYSWIPKFSFEHTMMEFPDAAGNYDMNEFDWHLPRSSTGTWSVDSGRLKGVGAGSSIWHYRWYDRELPPNFKLRFRKECTRGQVVFKGGDTTEYAFEWNATHVAFIKNGTDLARVPVALPATSEIILSVREIKTDLTTDLPEWMHVTVHADGLMVMTAAADISGGFPPLWFGFGAYHTDTVYYSLMRVPELTDFAETMTIDAGQPPISALQRILQGRPIELRTRFDGSLQAYLPKARAVSKTITGDNLFSFMAGVDRRALGTHMRVLGAYKELDLYEADMIAGGWPHKFLMHSNPNTVTSDEIYSDIRNLALLMREGAERAEALVHGNPFLEIGDRITVAGENDWTVIGISYEIEPPQFRQRMQLRRYDTRRDL